MSVSFTGSRGSNVLDALKPSSFWEIFGTSYPLVPNNMDLEENIFIKLEHIQKQFMVHLEIILYFISNKSGKQWPLQIDVDICQKQSKT